MIAFRSDHPVLSRSEWWAGDVEWFGVSGGPDLAGHSRSIAWHLPGLYVMVNMWWEPLDFAVQATGPWRIAIDTATEEGFVDRPAPESGSVTLGPRSIMVLTA